MFLKDSILVVLVSWKHDKNVNIFMPYRVSESFEFNFSYSSKEQGNGCSFPIIFLNSLFSGSFSVRI